MLFKPLMHSYPYYFSFTQFFHDHNFDPYSSSWIFFVLLWLYRWADLSWDWVVQGADLAGQYHWTSTCKVLDHACPFTVENCLKHLSTETHSKPMYIGRYVHLSWKTVINIMSYMISWWDCSAWFAKLVIHLVANIYSIRTSVSTFFGIRLQCGGTHSYIIFLDDVAFHYSSTYMTRPKYVYICTMLKGSKFTNFSICFTVVLYW